MIGVRVAASFQPWRSAGPTELRRAQYEDGADDDRGDPEPARGEGGLGKPDADQDGPGAGEQVAEVLADGDAQVNG